MRLGYPDPVGAAEAVPALVDAARGHRIGSLPTRPNGPDLYREAGVGTELTVSSADGKTYGDDAIPVGGLGTLPHGPYGPYESGAD
ncbi:hypothetical protein ACWDHW_15850 [Streptomyces melanosporofaciens]|uniref:hypothetical protein n=1 Tax=unclassified Streptomyces TaxID=2593676 RepID=UPI00367834A9